MNDEAEICQCEQCCVGPEYRRTVFYHHWRQHAEHAERSQRHDIFKNLTHHIVEAERHLARHLAFLAYMHHGDAKEKRNHYDLHHRHRAHWKKDVVGKHGDYLIHHRHVRCIDNICYSFSADFDGREKAFHQTWHYQAERHGEESRYYKIY